MRDVFALLYHSRCSKATMCLTTFHPPSKSVSRAPLIDDEKKLEELSKCPEWDTDRSRAQ